MLQHASQTCDEGTWVPLIEYSIKSGLSLSTIRRKIKSNSIPYRLDKGKYFILFSNDSADATNVSQVGETVQKPQGSPTISPRFTDRKLTPRESEGNFDINPVSYREPRKEADTHAFERVLNEKETRIRLLENRTRELEERVNELQLLIKVLEEKYDVRY